MTINLTDYSSTAAQRGWGLGWPSCSGAAGKTVVVTAARSGVQIAVHQRIARLLQMLVDETERRGYLLRSGQCWGYNCRAIAGTKVPSNHSWSLAVDINSLANPYVAPRVTDMPAWMPLLWNRYGWAWGGNYNQNGRTGKADSMHYEFMGTPADADAMTALALLELGRAPSAAPGPGITPTAPEEDPVNIDLQWSADGLSFRGVVGAECGKDSARFGGGWIKVSAAWAGVGPVDVRIVALRNGTGVGKDYDKTFTVPNNGFAYMTLPPDCQLATVEGHRKDTNTLVNALWIPAPR